MKAYAKASLIEWLERQRRYGRQDMYVLQLDYLGNVIGKQLRNPLVSPILQAGRWSLINNGDEEGTDWGYVWFGFRKLSLTETVCKSRSLTVFSSGWQTERVLRRNYFLYVAVDARGFFGTIVTRSWTCLGD